MLGMSGNFRPVTHVIFDMDGVLLNTEDLYTEVYQQICGEYGRIYDWDLKMSIMGTKPLVAAERVISVLELPLSAEDFISKTKIGIQKIFPTAKLLPGAQKLVEHLKRKGVPIAICTGSSKAAFEVKSTNHQEFFSNFHHITLCGDDPEVKNGKPHPDGYIVCNSRFDNPPTPDKVLVIEDAPNGVTAALRAGMQVVMVPDFRVPLHMRQDATVVIESLLNFVPEQFGLPAIDF